MSELEKDHPSPSEETKMTDIEKVPVNGQHHDNVSQLSAKERAEAFVAPTPQEENKVIRKLDRRLMPIVFFLYMLAVLDRSNLGNAKLAGMEDGTKHPS
jgi:hypothetical protein